MAKPPCMNEDGNVAVFVGTMLDTGDALAVCNECFAVFIISVASEMTGVDPTAMLAGLSNPDTVPAAVTDGALVDLTPEQARAYEVTPGPLTDGPTPPGSPEAGTDDDQFESEKPPPRRRSPTPNR